MIRIRPFTLMLIALCTAHQLRLAFEVALNQLAYSLSLEVVSSKNKRQVFPPSSEYSTLADPVLPSSEMVETDFVW